MSARAELDSVFTSSLLSWCVSGVKGGSPGGGGDADLTYMQYIVYIYTVYLQLLRPVVAFDTDVVSLLLRVKDAGVINWLCCSVVQTERVGSESSS